MHVKALPTQATSVINYFHHGRGSFAEYIHCGMRKGPFKTLGRDQNSFNEVWDVV